MSPDARIDGDCESRFAAVRDVFARSFETGEVGAALAVTIAGRPVIDLWGGHRDAARTTALDARHAGQRLLDHQRA